MEFFNTYQIKGNTKYAKMGEKIVTIDKHLIVDVLRFPTKVAKNKSVATLALGSRLRQRGCKGAGQEEARESHHRLPGV